MQYYNVTYLYGSPVGLLFQNLTFFKINNTVRCSFHQLWEIGKIQRRQENKHKLEIKLIASTSKPI